MRLSVLLLGAFLCTEPLAASAQSMQPTPRYTQGLGVVLANPSLTIISRRFECQEGSEKRRYVLDPHLGGTLVILETKPGSPARRAGLRCGDVIVAIDDAPVRDIREARAAMQGSSGLVLVHFLRPEQTRDLVDERHIDEWSTRAALMETIPIDLLAGISEERPEGLVSRIAIPDSFGPRLSVSIASRFTALSDDELEYTCSITYDGDDDMLYLESRHFTIVGRLDPVQTIMKGSSLVMRFRSSIARDGLPRETRLPMRLARRIFFEKTELFITGGHGSLVGRIGTDRDDDWYAWEQASPACYVPESVAFRIGVQSILPRIIDTR